MNECCELSYNKIYNKSNFCCTISNVHTTYDPVAFGKWLTEAFEESQYKSWQQVANALGKIRGATRSTLSRYAGAKPQHLTDVPSQPKPALVIALAKLFDKNVNEALALAGHAGLTDEIDSYEICDGITINFLDPRITQADKATMLESFRLIVGGMQVNKMNEREKKALSLFDFNEDNEIAAPEIKRGSESQN